MAVSAANLLDDDAEQALRALGSGSSISPGLRERLRDMVEALDDEYFTLGAEEGSPDKLRALNAFSKARAALALAYATGSADELHEAIYEAMAATEDSNELIAAVTKALQVVS